MQATHARVKQISILRPDDQIEPCTFAMVKYFALLRAMWHLPYNGTNSFTCGNDQGIGKNSFLLEHFHIEIVQRLRCLRNVASAVKWRGFWRKRGFLQNN